MLFIAQLAFHTSHMRVAYKAVRANAVLLNHGFALEPPERRIGMSRLYL
jgi:hypothetical protein